LGGGHFRTTGGPLVQASDFPDLPETTPPRDVAVLHHMHDTGGSFVRALADAWFKADPHNQRLMHGAFGHYYQQYRDSLYSNDASAEVVDDPDQATLLQED
jgi:hypothetical protein